MSLIPPFSVVLPIAFGGALGALCRYFTMAWLRMAFPDAHFIATLTVNLAGSFMMGIALAYSLRSGMAFFLMVGFLGSYTTFSAFSADLLTMISSQTGLAFFYICLSTIGGVAMCFLGYYLVRYFS